MNSAVLSVDYKVMLVIKVYYWIHSAVLNVDYRVMLVIKVYY